MLVRIEAPAIPPLQLPNTSADAEMSVFRFGYCLNVSWLRVAQLAGVVATSVDGRAVHPYHQLVKHQYPDDIVGFHTEHLIAPRSLNPSEQIDVEW